MFYVHSGGVGRHGTGRGSRRWGPFEVRWDTTGEGPRGRGRRRVFDGGELRLVLLKLIADQPRHGYDLIREIEELTGGAYAPSPGIVYPTITLLDDMGLIEAQQSEGSKKQFAVTDAGTQHLVDNAEEVAALIARLTDMGNERERTDSASVRRAMGNLRSVLIHKISRGDVDLKEIHEMVVLIDEVAQKIERL